MSDESYTEVINVPANVDKLREQMARAAERAGRSSGDIRLIGVTKGQSAERVLEAVRAGVEDLGENYVQEAREKIPAVLTRTERPITWHCIGHLQTNKAKYCPDLFAVVQTVDNSALARELAKQAAKRGVMLPVLLEVNLSGEEQRAGVRADALTGLVEETRGLSGLTIRGLMGMPPVVDSAEATRPYFRKLFRLWETLPAENRQILSMGMSGDFEVAIEEGATHVRIGTALFGRRKLA